MRIFDPIHRHAGDFQWNNESQGVVPVQAKIQTLKKDDLCGPLFIVLARLAGRPDAIASVVDHFDNPAKASGVAGNANMERGDLSNELAQLLGLWDLALKRDLKLLEKHIRVEGSGAWFESHPLDAPGLGTRPRTTPIPTEAMSNRPADKNITPTDEYVQFALNCVRKQIDQRLSEHATGLRVAFVAGLDGRPDELALRPSTIEAFLWLEFAVAVESGRGYGQCDACQRWFELGDKSGDSASRFCSTKCRMEGYRIRQAKARQMHKKRGMSFEEIAEKLNSTPKVVKGWVTGRSKRANKKID